MQDILYNINSCRGRIFCLQQVHSAIHVRVVRLHTRTYKDSYVDAYMHVSNLIVVMRSTYSFVARATCADFPQTVHYPAATVARRASDSAAHENRALAARDACLRVFGERSLAGSVHQFDTRVVERRHILVIRVVRVIGVVGVIEVI